MDPVKISDAGKETVNTIPGAVASSVATVAVPSVKRITVGYVIGGGKRLTGSAAEDCKVFRSVKYLAIKGTTGPVKITPVFS
jgi:hypothetical protein